MSTFEISGTVASSTPQTSKQGKAYLTFRITDGESIFDLSLFGQSMSFASKLRDGVRVEVKGMLTTREYQGKYYPNFQVQWVEVVTDKVAPAPRGDKMPVAQSSLDDLPF